MKMTILFIWQEGSLNKPKNALSRQLLRHSGLSEVYELVAWICVMVSSGLKANSKKIEGRLFESHPGSYLSPPHTHLSLSRSHRLVCRSGRPMQRRGQFHYPEKLNRKTKPSRVRLCVRVVEVISLFGGNVFLFFPFSFCFRFLFVLFFVFVL